MQKEKFALFIDVDRTLTGKNHIIHERNIKAINKARKLGHKVFINTGRSQGNIPEIILNQVEFDGVLSGNGTMVVIGKKQVYSDFMSKDTVAKLAHYCFENKETWAVFEGRLKSYTIANRFRAPSEIEIPVNTVEEYFAISKRDDIQTVATSNNLSNEFLTSLEDEITYFAFDHYYDIVTKGKNKAVSMLKALEILNIPVKNAIAFGDSSNDAQMLKTAGTAVAVANAQEHVKAIADFVSLSNEEGGVGQAIEELLLKEEI